VPFNQSELMDAALRKAGVPVQLIRIEGGPRPDVSGSEESTGLQGGHGEVVRRAPSQGFD
jgi:hypothetical protein